MRIFLQRRIIVLGRRDIGESRFLGAVGLEGPGISVSLSLLWTFEQRGVALAALRTARFFLKDDSLWALANS